MITATYCPEDNKLRIYPDGTRIDSILDEQEYAEFKKAGYKWASKQECFVCARWTPEAEDWALEFVDEIEDEDYSPEERSADRAERFSNYRDKRRAEAGALADRFDDGPQVFGHQSQSRAERQARRHDRLRTNSLTRWSKAEYWQQRTAGVISHAIYRSSAHVRRGRLLKLEAEQRKSLARTESAIKYWQSWEKIRDCHDADKATSLAKVLTGNSTEWAEREHPRTGRKSSLYGLLTDPVDPISGHEAAALYFSTATEPGLPGSRSDRWAKHYELRIGYEKAMLEAEGGMAAEVEMEPGGYIQGHQILKVNESPATGRVTSVGVWGPHPWNKDADGQPEMGIRVINIERLGENAYQPPTGEQRKEFAEKQAAKKKAPKASKPKAPTLINPTDEDAQKLQDIWNAKAAERRLKSGNSGEVPKSEVRRMTQAQYSAISKGSYAHAETVEVSENLEEKTGARNRVAVFKVRKCHASGSSFYTADRVIILTDKPQKSIPWDAVEAAKAEQVTEDDVFPHLGELARILGDWTLRDNPEAKQLIADAGYVGWAYSNSHIQKGFTEAGVEAYRRFRESEVVHA